MTTFNPALIANAYLGGAGLGTQQFDTMAALAARRQEQQFRESQAAIANQQDAERLRMEGQRLGMAQENHAVAMLVAQQEQEERTKDEYFRRALSEQFRSKMIGGGTPAPTGAQADVDAAFSGGGAGRVRPGTPTVGGMRGMAQVPGMSASPASPQSPEIEDHNKTYRTLSELALHVPRESFPLMASFLHDATEAKKMVRDLDYFKSSAGMGVVNSVVDDATRSLIQARIAMGDTSGAMRELASVSESNRVADEYDRRQRAKADAEAKAAAKDFAGLVDAYMVEHPGMDRRTAESRVRLTKDNVRQEEASANAAKKQPTESVSLMFDGKLSGNKRDMPIATEIGTQATPDLVDLIFAYFDNEFPGEDRKDLEPAVLRTLRAAGWGVDNYLKTKPKEEEKPGLFSRMLGPIRATDGEPRTMTDADLADIIKKVGEDEASIRAEMARRNLKD